MATMNYLGTINKYDTNHLKDEEVLDYEDQNIKIHIKIRRTQRLLNFYKIFKEEFKENGYKHVEIVRYKYPYKHYYLSFKK